MRILIGTWGSYGDVNPYLGLAVALKARGHHPILATLEHARKDVEREGIEFREAGPRVDPDDQVTLARVMHPTRGSEYLLRDLLFPNAAPWFEQLDAAAEGVDLIVNHTTTIVGPLVAERRKLPWLSGILSPVSLFSRTDFPALPPALMLSRFRQSATVNRLLFSLIRRVTGRWTRPLHALRARIGLPPGGNPIFEGQYSPYGTLALFSRLLAEPQPDWPVNVVRAGAIIYDRTTGGDRLAPDLESFLGAGPPPVVFTLGTSAVGAPGAFYAESVEAVRRLGLRAVLLIGRFPGNRPSGVLPASIHVEEVAPHSLLFPRAAAIVHQGGAGTVAQALRAGRPQVVVPHAHDQPDFGARLTRLGVARTIAPPRYRARRVARFLQTLLSEPSVLQRAEAVAATVHGESGTEAACRAIESLARSHSP